LFLRSDESLASAAASATFTAGPGIALEKGGTNG
jgi:hypothetical protein